MNYANIKYFDIANGEGVRTTLFVSGCTNHCKNCFQPETWDFNYGNPFNEAIENQIIESLKPYFIAGLTVLGGEPMEIQNQRGLLPFLKKIKEIYPEKNIWLYTGFVLEKDIINPNGKRHCEITDELLRYIDVMVDGPFIQEKYDISLRFKGSTNQRIIDMKKTREKQEIVLYME